MLRGHPTPPQQQAEDYVQDGRELNDDDEEDPDDDSTLVHSNNNCGAREESDEDIESPPGKRKRRDGHDENYYGDDDGNEDDDERGRRAFRYGDDSHVQNQEQESDDERDEGAGGYGQDYRQSETLQEVYDQTVSMDPILDATAEKTASTVWGLSQVAAARERQDAIKRQLQTLVGDFKEHVRRTVSQLEDYASKVEAELDADFIALSSEVQAQLAQNNALELRIRNATQALQKNRPALDIILKVISGDKGR